MATYTIERLNASDGSVNKFVVSKFIVDKTVKSLSTDLIKKDQENKIVL